MSCNVHLSWDMPTNASQFVVTITEQPMQIGSQLPASPVPMGGMPTSGPGTYNVSTNAFDVTLNEGVGVRVEVKSVNSYGESPPTIMEFTTPSRNAYLPSSPANLQASLTAWV